MITRRNPHSCAKGFLPLRSCCPKKENILFLPLNLPWKELNFIQTVRVMPWGFNSKFCIQLSPFSENRTYLREGKNGNAWVRDYTWDRKSETNVCVEPISREICLMSMALVGRTVTLKFIFNRDVGAEVWSLDPFSHVYKRACPSVRWLVRW